MTTRSYNPIDYGFAWTDTWYSWDHAAAHKAARQERDREARALRAQDKTVRCSRFAGALMSRGGIGSGHPHIELYVTVYSLAVVEAA